MEPIQAGEILTFEGVEVYTKNFDGNKFGPGGQRSLGFYVDPQVAAELEDRDCPGLKWTDRWDDAPEDWESRPWIKASIGFNYRPPAIYQITTRGARALDQFTIDNLQRAKIDGPIDVAVRVAPWEMNGNVGLKLWVTEMYVRIEETALAAKYAHLIQEGEENDDE